MDISKIDLNKPYNDPSLNIPEVSAEKQEIDEKKEPPKEPPKEEPKEESKEVVKEPEKEPVAVPDEKPRVTYSRFKNVHQRAIDAEREARETRAKLEELESKRELYRPAETSPGQLPDWWVRLYGDSDAAKEAYQIQSRRERELLDQAEERAIQKVEERQREARKLQEENEKSIDDGLEDLSAFIGRELTEKEQSEILDIVDEYTPKGDDGNYLGAPLPFDKAWEIYELKNEAKKAPKKQSRDNVAALSSSQTQGETTIEAEKDKNFNPFDWNAYKRRI